MSVTHSMSVALLRFCFFLLDMLSFVYAYTSWVSMFYCYLILS